MLDWSERLEALGFVSSPGGMVKRSLFVRPRGIREQNVVLSGHRYVTGTVVQIGISMRDPFSPSSERGLILVGELSREEGVLSDVPGTGTWWQLDDDPTAWRYFDKHGLPWLERYSDPAELIRFYELARAKRPPIFDLWLSLLYQEAGDLERAAGHCLAYYDVVKTRPPGLSDEPQRTLAQLSALGREPPAGARERRP